MCPSPVTFQVSSSNLLSKTEFSTPTTLSAIFSFRSNQLDVGQLRINLMQIRRFLFVRLLDFFAHVSLLVRIASIVCLPFQRTLSLSLASFLCLLFFYPAASLFVFHSKIVLCSFTPIGNTLRSTRFTLLVRTLCARPGIAPASRSIENQSRRLPTYSLYLRIHIESQLKISIRRIVCLLARSVFRPFFLPHPFTLSLFANISKSAFLKSFRFPLSGETQKSTKFAAAIEK